MSNDWNKAPLVYFSETIDFAYWSKCQRDIIILLVVDLSLAQSHDWLLLFFPYKIWIKKLTGSDSVLSTVLNQKPPLLEPKPAKTRPKNFYQKNHHNFRPNRHNFRNFEVEKLNFLQIPLMFTEKCENIAFFSTRPKEFFPPQESPKPPKTRQPATFTNTVSLKLTLWLAKRRTRVGNWVTETKFKSQWGK